MATQVYITVDPLVKGELTHVLNSIRRDIHANGWPVVYLGRERRSLVFATRGTNEFEAVIEAIHAYYRRYLGIYVSREVYIEDQPLPNPSRKEEMVSDSLVAIMRAITVAAEPLVLDQIAQAVSLSKQMVRIYLQAAIARGWVAGCQLTQAGREYLNALTAVQALPLGLRGVLYAFLDNPQYFWSIQGLADHLGQAATTVSHELTYARQEGWVTLAGYGPPQENGKCAYLFRLRYDTKERLCKSL